MRSTRYFQQFACQKHPEIEESWIERILANPLTKEHRANGRMAYWGNIEEADGRVIRVITLEDSETVHNAFFDRNFYKRQQRGEETK
ncbi:MAG: hypothetical protein KA717_18070 [Woronichinia naegeliana WA131]|jgi:hypothetical protein|uniref:DUF4258 domain-containing protein n=1 Tax=Woronichinia naegeliana WA131 TaxID=2824559 RepID=A0A977PYX4_9CYAN|nr:MAG: hypothetical protein KA717_18070 [Woronichinia naegeliana WA131]